MRMPRMYRVVPVLMISLLALSCSRYEVAPADADRAAASAPLTDRLRAALCAALAVILSGKGKAMLRPGST